MIQSIKRFFEPLKNTKGSAYKLIIIGSIVGLIQIGVVEAFRYATYYLETGTKELFIFAMISLFVLECMHLLNQRFFKKYDRYMMYDFKKEIYTKVLRKFMILDHNFADLLGIGRLQSILLNGVHRWSSFLFEILLKGSTMLVVTIGSIYVLFKTNLYVGFGAIVSLSIVFIIFIERNEGDRKYRRIAKEGAVEINKLSVMQMMSKFEIIQSNRLDKELQRYGKKIDVQADIETDRGMYNFLAYRAVFSFFNCVQVVALFVTGYLVLDGKILLSDFFVMVLAFRLLLKMLADFKVLIRLYSKEFIDVEKIREVFDNGPKLQGVFEGEDFVHTGVGIEMKRVGFGYDSTDLIFENFDLQIVGGTKTALVGLSGGGKSTLVKLIAGYLRPTTGSICIDGQDLRDISLKSYYKHVGYLTQEPSVFDGTVIENLTYAIDTEVSDQKLQEVIRLAKCDFVRDFPEGLNTEIGERGIRLSGGQRQRLAIAKVFLKDPEIIILDEPTSALDSFSEEAITQAMNNLFVGRTVIIIAHRLQTVKHADDIIVLDHGKIVERGTHQELVGLEGSYAKMLELQSGF